jgi:putative flippase GtrA
MTATHYVLLIALVEGLGADPTISSAASYTGLTLLNYALNYSYTFKATVPHHRTLPRFTVVALVALAVNTAVMYTLERLAGLHYIAAQLCATALTLVWTFSANHFWAFQRGSRSS